MESGCYALGVSKNDMNEKYIYSSLKSSDIKYDKIFLRRGIGELQKKCYAFIRNIRCIMKVPGGEDFLNIEYKNYVRGCLLGRGRFKFDRVSNDIYIVAISNVSRKKLEKKQCFNNTKGQVGLLVISG